MININSWEYEPAVEQDAHHIICIHFLHYKQHVLARIRVSINKCPEFKRVLMPPCLC